VILSKGERTVGKTHRVVAPQSVPPAALGAQDIFPSRKSPPGVSASRDMTGAVHAYLVELLKTNVIGRIFNHVQPSDVQLREAA